GTMSSTHRYSATLVSIVALASAHGSAQQTVRVPSPLHPCFNGTGGPNGDFDWVVHNGDVFFFDTSGTVIPGGPGGAITTTETSADGVVDVRNLTIEAGGQVRVQGPNPMRILATGEVVIRGRLDLSGFAGHDVATLNTGNQSEAGGAGCAGGGRGGIGNPVTTGSSPRGGSGSGPFGALNGGGGGGETAYAPAALGKDSRRPGGGGGGRFARDQGPGLSASSGLNGHPNGTGAESGLNPARGGDAGPSAFTDHRSGNDFFGME